MVKRHFATHASESKGPQWGTRSFQVAEDIVPIAELKARLSETIRGLDQRERPLVITLNGKPAAVLMSPRAFDELSYRTRVLESLADGLADDAAGKTISGDELRRRVEQRYGRRAKAGKPGK